MNLSNFLLHICKYMLIWIDISVRIECIKKKNLFLKNSFEKVPFLLS